MDAVLRSESGSPRRPRHLASDLLASHGDRRRKAGSKRTAISVRFGLCGGHTRGGERGVKAVLEALGIRLRAPLLGMVPVVGVQYCI